MSNIPENEILKSALTCAIFAAKQAGVNLNELMENAEVGVLDSASNYSKFVIDSRKPDILDLIKESINAVMEK